MYKHLKLSMTLENSVCYCYTSYEMTDQFLWFQVQWTATSGIGIYPTKTWLSQLVNFKNVIWTRGRFRRMICRKFCFKLGKMPQKRMEYFRLLLEHLALIEHQFLSGIRDSRKAGESVSDDERCGKNKGVYTPGLMSQSLGLGLLCWGFKGVKEEILSEEDTTPYAQWLSLWDNWGDERGCD